MLLMIESGIRGGIATISHRHAKVNNEYMGTEFDPTKDSKFISYLDANNILWLGNVKTTSNVYMWMDDRWWTWWLKTSELFPWSWLRVSERFTIPNLSNKTNYVVHYEHLKLYKSLRLKIQRFIEVLNLKEVPGWKNTLI